MLYLGSLLVATVLASTTPAVTNEHVKQRIYEEFKDTPALIDVAYCESNFRHFDEYGNVLRGKEVKEDIGVLQINEYYHRKTAEDMGLNIDLLDDNIAYAKILYLKNGLRDWKASWPCMIDKFSSKE